MECKECFGYGKYDVGPDCDLPASMCCGGCYKTVECKKCNGTGKIEEMKNPVDEIYKMWVSSSQREFDRWISTNHKRLSQDVIELMEGAYYNGFNEPLPFATFEHYLDGIKDTGETN